MKKSPWGFFFFYILTKMRSVPQSVIPWYQHGTHLPPMKQPGWSLWDLLWWLCWLCGQNLCRTIEQNSVLTARPFWKAGWHNRPGCDEKTKGEIDKHWGLPMNQRGGQALSEDRSVSLVVRMWPSHIMFQTPKDQTLFHIVVLVRVFILILL